MRSGVQSAKPLIWCCNDGRCNDPHSAQDERGWLQIRSYFVLTVLDWKLRRLRWHG
jgi:hypothetical protein